jgi:polyisoprenyl-teichoic acid--peptidoglycan teichoic acid transferase
MREFPDYTKAARAARWRWFLWSLVAGLLVVALVVGMRAGAIPTPMETLGYGVEGASRAHAPGGSVWLREILGGTEVSEGPLNVLVLGVDERPDGEEAGSRTDTIMVVQVLPETGEVKLLSVPRDLLVEIEPGVEDRINAAYAYGGIEQTMSALQGYTGVPIEYYAVVDFEGFRDVINAMGGVEMDVEDEIPPKYGIQDGLQTLNGAQALFYARYRGTACGDLDRIERQQQLVAALRSKALRWDTAARVPEMGRVMNRNVETNLGFDQAVALGRTLISRGRGAQMMSTRLKGTPDTLENGNKVLLPDETANEAVMQQFFIDEPRVGEDTVTRSADSSKETC